MESHTLTVVVMGIDQTGDMGKTEFQGQGLTQSCRIRDALL